MKGMFEDQLKSSKANGFLKIKIKELQRLKMVFFRFWPLRFKICLV